MNSIRILFSVVVNLSWPLFQLDVKNAFLYGDLHEVYMEQPPGYIAQRENLSSQEGYIWSQVESKVWFEKFSITISGIGFHWCDSDHSVFVRRIKTGIVVLTVYVNDILLTGSDSVRLLESILNTIWWPRTWGGLNTLWRLKLQIKNIMCFLNESVLWI